MTDPTAQEQLTDSCLAIVGLHCRTPGANNHREFWRNLSTGVESITRFQDEELRRSGVEPALLTDPDYVRARAVLDGIELFDASFFGYTPREAELMDPQHRLFLECAWEALEMCGYLSPATDLRTGVFAGCAMNTYLLHNLSADRELIRETDYHKLLIGNDKDFLATRVSYKLDLKGPSINVSTACSTSLVAVHLAGQSLLSGECDLALAGGVSIPVPHRTGYLYQESGILSPDGRCRAFDAEARGTAVGSGVAVVVLRRLADALAGGETVYAVIRGSAVNNDGSLKTGYTAPSVQGQTEVIAEALTVAGVNPETIGYVETHGTGTALGDPIEISALTKAYRAGGARRNGYCAIGSLKTNIGHLDAAAGAAGLIKAALALHHRQIPPSLNFASPNPEIDFADSPFYVATGLTEWPRNGHPRRAGVSSFGLGGTNAHVILEEAPRRGGAAQPAAPTLRPYQLLPLSAKTSTALAQAAIRLDEHLQQHADLSPADVAFTLSTGRREFAHRQVLIGPSGDWQEQTIRRMESEPGHPPLTAVSQGVAPNSGDRPVVFLFPGGGAQHPRMGQELYYSEPVFRDRIDHCAELLKPHLSLDLRELLYPAPGRDQEAALRLERPALAMPALFVVEYALAQLWISWSIRPQALIGHSLGEYAAACLAGVFSLEDALALVAYRGKLFEQLAPGAMLSVNLSEDQLRPLLNGSLSIAAVNNPVSCVISGPVEAAAKLEAALTAGKVQTRRLRLSAAAHSLLVEPVLDQFHRFLERLQFHPPAIRWVSNLTGAWITEAQATDPNYWCQHLRQTVRFADGVQRLFEEPEQILLEVGPGQTLTNLLYQHPRKPIGQLAVSSLPHSQEPQSDAAFLLTTLGKLWTSGVSVNWEAFYQHEDRRRVPLTTYPFERQRYWIEPRPSAAPCSLPAEEIYMSEQNNSRHTLIVDKLKEILAKISGLRPEEIVESRTFFELGLDSLTLVQVSRSLKNQFGLKLSIQQLMDGCSTLSALAAEVEAQTNWGAEEAPAAPAPAPPIAPIAPKTAAPRAAAPERAGPAATSEPGSAADHAREQLIAQQLEIMRMQLEVLRGGPAPPSLAQPAPAAQPVRSRIRERVPAGSEPSGSPARKPLHFSSQGQTSMPGFTPRQREHLEALIARYTQRTRRSKEYAQQHRAVLADSRAAVGFRPAVKEMLYPIVGARGAGSHFLDLDGNEYVDLTNGFGVTLFGHHPPFLTEALKECAGQEMLLGPRSPLVGEAAQLISELTGLDRVTFCNSGTEAVMAALRLARTKTGRSRIVMFEGAYHGHSDQTLVQSSLGDDDSGDERSSEPMAPGIPPEAVANTIVLEYGTPESLEYIRRHAGELAAVIVEPVQNLRLDLQPVEFLRELREITRAAGCAYIFDEMITGFRIHPGGAQAYFGVEADLVTYGKVIGGGMPIGVVAGRAEFMDGIDGGYWQYGDGSFPAAERTFFGGTFCQHPLTMVATLATLKELRRQGPELQERLNRRTTELAQTLNRYFEDEEVPIRVVHFGSAFRFTVSGNVDLLFFHMLERGIYLWEWRGCFLSAAHTEQDLEQVVRCVKESVEELRSGEFLPARRRAVPSEIAEEAAPKTAVEPEPVIPGPIPLTEAQKQLWLMSQIDENGSRAYQTGLSLRLKGPLRLDHLSRAARQMVARHEALRTVISPQGDSQRVESSSEIELELVDYSGVPQAGQAAPIEEWFEQKSRAAMPLDRGPLFRIQVLRLAEEVHVLVMTAHHIITDGWSMTNLVVELMAFYSAACRGVVLKAEPPMQFRQYVQWQEEYRTSDELAEHAAYWLNQFRDSIPVLDWPSDYPHPLVKSYRSGRCTLKIESGSTRQLRALCSEHNCTLFMLLYAAYTALAHRLTGQPELLIGLSASGRSLEGSESVTGYCTHLLPVRNRIEGAAPFLDHLARTRQSLLAAYEHQDYPFAWLLNNLGLKREAGRSPLISATFNLDRPTPIPNAHGLELELFPHPTHFADFDLMLNVIDINDELVVDCDYSADLFLHGTIENLLGQYRTLLEGVIANPRERLTRLPLLTDKERARILSPEPAAHEQARPNQCLHRMFEAQVRRNPQAPAISGENGHLTYGELNAGANQLAHHLKSRRVGPGALVGICLEPSPEMMIAIFGILKAGGAYVPLDPAYPKERLALLLEDSGALALVTRKRFLGQLPAQTGETLILLDADQKTLAQESTENPEVEIKPSDLAYVIYTSGSTGRPKGVLIEHRQVSRLFTSTEQCFHFGERDVWTLFHSYAFDFSVWEIFGALLYGGRLVTVPYWVARNPEAFYRLLIDEQVTVLNQTPSAFRQLMQAERAAGVDPRLNLRLIIFGGEALELASLKPWFDRHPETRPQLVNMYGITETTVHVTYRPLTARDTEWSSSRIGTPIPDLRLYILDPEMQLVPVGVTGELYVGGAGVARGYLNREELNRERFVPDPFRPGERIYKTGDLGRWLANGEAEYQGRIDEQVKIRGFRVELGEIASAMRTHPDVKDALVVQQAMGEPAGASQLVAYFIPSAPVADGSQEAKQRTELRVYLAHKLPDHMIPAVFMPVESFPLTPNGKIDKRALPLPSEAPAAATENYVPPRNAAEELLARIWAEILGLKQVGVYDNFFELG
ncbi:MAG TPA: amino acid adenylation domain-containing protein, partial [Blastocatellia bacterium]|nr:amino acid adenylation domain-containing protein [Blastocatellia bacterium]